VGSAPVLSPSVQDCVAAPPVWANYTPTAAATALMQSCVSSNATHGYGDDNDCDLTEIVLPDGSLATLFQYGASNQVGVTARYVQRVGGVVWELCGHPAPGRHP
jgi:hypothetical protein